MHIGIDASRAFLKERTGTEEYSFQLIKALSKLDIKNTYTLYVRRGQPSFLNFNLPDKFKIKVISFPRLFTQVGLALECLVEAPEVLFVPAHTLPVFRRPNLKTVVTIHDLGAEFLPQYHQFPQKIYLNASTKYAASFADRIIAVSRSSKKDLICKLGCKPEKITVVYEGYDEKRFKAKSEKTKLEAVRKKYGIKDRYILFVGTIQPRKNLAGLIEAFSAVAKKRGNLDLLLVGKPGWMYKEIYRAPKKFGIKERVRFLDYISGEDLPTFYQNALCLALPSLHEGFGLPILEAMACGCPVVASRAGSLPELVGDAGLLIDPESARDLAKNLDLMVASPFLRKSFREKGFSQVKKFSWEKCAKETLRVLEKDS